MPEISRGIHVFYPWPNVAYVTLSRILAFFALNAAWRWRQVFLPSGLGYYPALNEDNNGVTCPRPSRTARHSTGKRL
jgi:hypothetical protein